MKTETEQNFYIMCGWGEKFYIVHKLPGEVRHVAKITLPGATDKDRERYARLIVDALNEKAERDEK